MPTEPDSDSWEVHAHERQAMIDLLGATDEPIFMGLSHHVNVSTGESWYTHPITGMVVDPGFFHDDASPIYYKDMDDETT